MHRYYYAALLAGLLLIPACTMVPFVVAGADALSRETLHDTMNMVMEETEQKDVELNTMHFTPSASSEDGIYYVCRRGVATVAYFGVSRVHYSVDGALFTLEYPGSREVIPIGEESTGSITSYFLGSDPGRWRAGLADCSVLRYHELYPGIDLVYRLRDGLIKYEFVVQPGADPGVIQMRYPEADAVRVSDERVLVSNEGTEMVDQGLWAFQHDTGLDDVSCVFRSQDINTIALSVGSYDPSRELVIDPAIHLAYSTFLGGTSEDRGYGIAVDSGCAYVTGYTQSPGFPTANAYDSTYAANRDCFVVKLAVDGQSLVYSTFLGGAQVDYGYGIAVESGCAYVTGYTYSSEFPTVNAYDSTLEGYDCFVTKFAADGQSLVYSTLLGGQMNDIPDAIAVESGCAYLTGVTQSSAFPTVNAYDSTYAGGDDCFVTKFAADGQSLTYSTFLGEASDDSGRDIDVDGGFAYVTGSTASSGFPTVNAYDATFNLGIDCFVTKFAGNGQSLVYSTFLGGTGSDTGMGIAVENGLAYVVGSTQSPGFPTVNAYDSAYAGGDCFVTKFAGNGQSLVYSTFLGGTGSDGGMGIAVENGLAYVTGYTYSSEFPTVNAYDATYNGGTDCFVTEFAAGGQSLVYSTFLGGTSEEVPYDIAVNSACAYVIGYSGGYGFPTARAYDPVNHGAYDCFVSVLSPDSDMDGLSDWDEARCGTDPFCIDSDRDSFIDSYEVTYGSDPLDALSYPPIPQAWYEAIYEDLDGNATLVQYLITWSNGNSTLLENVMRQLDDNTTLLGQVISWLDGNHTAIDTLFTSLDGNATLLLQTVDALDGNSTQLDLIAALVTQNAEALSKLNATLIGNINEIRAVLNMLGVTVGDTDCDGLDDLDEITLGTDILCIDTDCDNLNDAYEVKIGTDPTDDDSDNDTYYDGAEVLAGTDPLDSLDYPGSITTTTTTTQPPMGIELVIIAGAAGSIGIAMLLVIMKRRAATKSSA